jgi:hypothetical protein
MSLIHRDAGRGGGDHLIVIGIALIAPLCRKKSSFADMHACMHA